MRVTPTANVQVSMTPPMRTCREEHVFPNPGAKGDAPNAAPDVAPKAREAAQQLLASALLAPLMAGVRNDPLASDLFGEGFAQDAWQQQLDSIFADRIASASGLPLVDAIVKRLTPEQSVRIDAHA